VVLVFPGGMRSRNATPPCFVQKLFRFSRKCTSFQQCASVQIVKREAPGSRVVVALAFNYHNCQAAPHVGSEFRQGEVAQRIVKYRTSDGGERAVSVRIFGKAKENKQQHVEPPSQQPLQKLPTQQQEQKPEATASDFTAQNRRLSSSFVTKAVKLVGPAVVRWKQKGKVKHLLILQTNKKSCHLLPKFKHPPLLSLMAMLPTPA